MRTKEEYEKGTAAIDDAQKEQATLRKIIHIDMDAFYASVEQRDHPEYRGRPVAVGGAPERRGVVAAASYEARKYGIRSAMSSYRAVRLCPDLVFLPPRFQVYKEVSRQIHTIFADYTDWIEPLSLDEAYLDVTENKRGLTTATLTAKEIRRRIFEDTGLTASAGVSYNKFLAKTASDFNKPDGLTVITPERTAAFIDQLPIGAFYGIGKKTAPKLQSLGIETGADLKALSPEAMARLFGSSAEFYYNLVRGIDHRPVETDWVRKSVGAENTFERDLDDWADMLAELEQSAAEVMDWMNRHETYGRTLTVKVKYADFQLVTRSRTVTRPFRELTSIMTLAEELLALTEAGPRKVRLLGVSVSNLITPEESDQHSDGSLEVDPARQLVLEF